MEMTRSERTEENEALIAPSPFDSSAELGVRDKALKFRDGAVIGALMIRWWMEAYVLSSHVDVMTCPTRKLQFKQFEVINSWEDRLKEEMPKVLNAAKNCSATVI